MAKKKSDPNNIAVNRRARHDYHIRENYEAGIVLKGTEVKSLREGRASLVDCYVTVKHGEVIVHNLHISPYEQGNRYNLAPKRERRLLLHKREIRKLIGATTRKGFTIVPLRLYFKKGLAKIEIALVEGKREYDKRVDLKKKDDMRDIDRHMKKNIF